MTLPIPTLNLTSWAGIAAGIALIASGWRYVSEFIRRLSDFVICRVTVQDSVANAVSSYVWERGRRSPFVVRTFGGASAYVQPKKRIEVIGYESIGGSAMLFWIGWTPVIVRRGGTSLGGVNSFNEGSHESPLFVWFIRGTLNIDSVIEKSIASFNQLTGSVANTSCPRRRFNVHRISRRQENVQENRGSNVKSLPDWTVPTVASSPEMFLKRIQSKEIRLLTWSPDDLIERSNDQAPFDLYPFPATALAVLSPIERWLKHEAWFRSKGIPHRRGVLLTGAPGTGKSTFVRSVAIKYDLPLYVFDLPSLDNQSFIQEWRSIQQNTPAIILLEDIDAIFHGREFIAKVGANRDTLTFDCLLNTISGVGSSDGILLFITTNHVDTLDPALGIPNSEGMSSRPGRIDHVIHFTGMGEEERRKLASFILADCPDDIEETIAAGDGETAVQFQERCAQIALTRWEQGLDPKVSQKDCVVITCS